MTLLAAVESGDFSDLAELDVSALDILRVKKQALSDEAVACDRAAGNDIERDSRKKQLAALHRSETSFREPRNNSCAAR